MLKPRQKLPNFGFGACILPEIRELENGSCEIAQVNQSDFVLPDPHVTDLGDVLKAGVPLKEVNSKVLPRKGNVNIVFKDKKIEEGDK